jgi:hypothetical protein
MVNYTQKSPSVAQACDGALGFSDGTNDFIAWGWISGSTSIPNLWKSTNGGSSFAAQADLPYPAHTLAAAKKANDIYVVGGDVFNPINSGDFIRSSGKFVGGVYSQIAANCGIADRCLGQLVYNDDTDEFLYFGGQRGVNITDGVYNTVMKSTNNCNSFTVIQADTTPYFAGGLLYGAVIYFKGLYWKICGALYDNNTAARTYVTKIFSSPDGITWTYRDDFKGIGRHYLQTIVYKNKIWLFGGYNSCYGGNLDDVWTIDWNGIRVQQQYMGTTPFTPRHAHTCWLNSQGIMFFGGTDNDAPTLNNDIWLITET